MSKKSAISVALQIIYGSLDSKLIKIDNSSWFFFFFFSFSSSLVKLSHSFELLMLKGRGLFAYLSHVFFLQQN